MIYQPIRPFPTTQPVAYKLNDSVVSKLWGWKPLSSIMYVVPWIRSKVTKLDINERIIEVPFVFRQINWKKAPKVLDVGSSESTVSLSLASLGCEVTAVDLRRYPLKHPNLKPRKGDIVILDLPSNSFDYVVCLSTLEHIGLPTMYGTVGEKTTDRTALKAMVDALKKGGKLVLTTPVAAKYSESSFQRVYTPKKLQSLLKSLKIDEISYYAPNLLHDQWEEVSEEELPTGPHFGVAAVVARKKS